MSTPAPSVPTPHISAAVGDFAQTVLMPGDPLRSKFIAENFLESPRLVNNVRGVYGYTGLWKKTPVSVMASGMGMPSIGIYSYELFSFYNVRNIIRVGSAGSISDKLQVRSLVAALAASTDSNFAHQYGLNGNFAPSADYALLSAAMDCAREMGVDMSAGNVLSADNFYDPAGKDGMDPWRDMGVLAVEMEAAALYMTAARTGKSALCICTVSDHVYTGESLSSEDRESSLTEMIEVALNTARKVYVE